MTGKTHVLGGMALGLGGFLCMRSAGMLIPDINEQLQVCIILPYAIWSSTVPDLDQDRESVGQKNPLNLFIQKIFKLTGAKHRSVKSHVVPMLISFVLYLLSAFNFIWSNLNGTEISILNLITLGLFLGFLSHFILDIMTKEGITINGIAIRVVPDSSVFCTGSYYEIIVRRVLYAITCILIVLLFT